jgi:streptogramin lyase
MLAATAPAGCKQVTGLHVTFCRLPASTVRVEVTLTSSSGESDKHSYAVEDPSSQRDLIALAPAGDYRLQVSAFASSGQQPRALGGDQPVTVVDGTVSPVSYFCDDGGLPDQVGDTPTDPPGERDQVDAGDLGDLGDRGDLDVVDGIDADADGGPICPEACAASERCVCDRECGCLREIAVNGTPRGLALDATGRVWFGNQTRDVANFIGADGIIDDTYEITLPLDCAVQDIAIHSEVLWASCPGTRQLAFVSLAPTSSATPLTASEGQPYSVTVDQDGFVYYVTRNPAKVGRVDTANGNNATETDGCAQSTSFCLANPYRIRAFVDPGMTTQVFFTDEGVSRIYQVSANLTLGDYNDFTSGAPRGLSSPDGSMLYVALHATNMIGYLPSDHMAYPAPGGPVDVAAVSVDEIWYTGQGVNSDAIGVLRQGALANMVRLGDAGDVGPTDILVDGDGTVWFTQTANSAIGYFRPQP